MGTHQLKERVRFGVNVMVLSFLALLSAIGFDSAGVVPIAVISTFTMVVALYSILGAIKKHSLAEEK